MKSTSFKTCGQIQDAEHFHTIFGYCELLVNDGNLAVAQCVDKGLHNCSVRNWNVRCC